MMNRFLFCLIALLGFLVLFSQEPNKDSKRKEKSEKETMSELTKDISEEKEDIDKKLAEIIKELEKKD